MTKETKDRYTEASNAQPTQATPALIAANDNVPQKGPQALFQNSTYSEYKSRLSDWDTRASVRVLPRRKLVGLDGHLPFSPDLVPITGHSLVKERGDTALHVILAQKLHTYLNFTEQLEMRHVIPTATNLRLNEMPFAVPYELQRDAGKVVTDEAHHADCAGDLDEQIIKVAGVGSYRKRLPSFAETLHKCRNPFPGCVQLLLETTFTTVSETLITGTLTQVPRDPRVAPAIREVITDHAHDEAKHHAVFAEVMRIMWDQLSPAQKDAIGPHWATFIQAFLQPDLIAELDWLEAAGFERHEADRIIKETYEAIDLPKLYRYAGNATIRLAKRHGLTDHAATRDGLEAAGLMEAAR
jgi:hypothetical protein